MTVYVNTTATVEVPEDLAIAAVSNVDGDISIWPQGMGAGPVITMSDDDWVRIRNSVEAARRVVYGPGVS